MPPKKKPGKPVHNQRVGTNQHTTKYTDEFRDEVTAYVAEHDSVADAARHYGLTKVQVSRWCKRSGVSVSAGKRLKMNQVREQIIKEQRERVRQSMLNNADLIAERIGELVSLGQLDTDDSKVLKDLTISHAILIDKFRLESGEVTTRESLIDERDAAGALGSRLDELQARRQQRQAQQRKVEGS